MEAYLQTLLDFQNSNKNSAPKSESERIDEMVNPKLGFTPVSMGVILNMIGLVLVVSEYLVLLHKMCKKKSVLT